MMYATTLIVSQACLPDLAALFTPPKPVVGRYEVCVQSEPIEHLVEAGKLEGLHYGAIDQVEPLEAFGSAGRYDRAAMARLYGGTRVRIVRGWGQQDDRFESVTLISPYPDVTLSRLNAGTMTIRFVVDHSTSDRRSP